MGGRLTLSLRVMVVYRAWRSASVPHGGTFSIHTSCFELRRECGVSANKYVATTTPPPSKPREDLPNLQEARADLLPELPNFRAQDPT